MMALNRHRLKHLASQGALGAKTTQGLLTRTDLLLSVILIGNKPVQHDHPGAHDVARAAHVRP